MTVECPICRAENESDSRICVKCATPFGMPNPAMGWSGDLDPGQTIALGSSPFPSRPNPSPQADAGVQTPEVDWRPGATGGDAAESLATGDQTGLRGVLALGYVLAGRYQILKVLGEGGMGAVYQARDREVDRTVAIKVIRPELSGHPEILRRFKQELILARQVTHRNVVRIFDLNQAEGCRFITMEYVDGKDLSSIVRERKKLPVDEAVAIVRQP